MKKIMQNRKTEKGFTLIEVIVTLTLAALLGSVLVSFMGTGIIQSSNPVKQIRDFGAASGCIETISADYESYMSGNRTASEWSAFKSGMSCTGIAIAKDPATSTYGMYSGSFETIAVTATKDNQTIVSYFVEQ